MDRRTDASAHRRRAGVLARFVVVSLLVAAGPVTAATTASATTPTRCSPTGVSIEVVTGGAGLGHVAAVIEVIDVGATACTLSGYPSVSAGSATDPTAVFARDTPSGYLGGYSPPVPSTRPRVWTLPAHGGKASSMVEGDDTPVGPATSCVTFTRLGVWLPGHSQGQVFHVTMPGCVPLDVHPFVRGTSGSFR